MVQFLKKREKEDLNDIHGFVQSTLEPIPRHSMYAIYAYIGVV